MRKRIALIFAAVLALNISAAFAMRGNRYDAYETDTPIYINGTEAEFELPVVTIDGNTYVPLREAAQKADLNVAWSGERNRITVTKVREAVDARKSFENIFGFALPNDAKLLHSDVYSEFEEDYFCAKISFAKEDFDYIKSNLESRFAVKTENADRAASDAARQIVHLGDVYAWWDLSQLSDASSFYYGYKAANAHKHMVDIGAFIKQSTDGEGCLYAFLR